MDIYFDRYPKIDLHGYSQDMARVMVKDFIYESYLMKVEYINIIHGRGEGKLMRMVFDELKQNKMVSEYKLDMFNPGCTIVKLEKKI